MSQLHLQHFTNVAADSVSASNCIDQSTALICVSYAYNWHRQHITLGAAHSVRLLTNMKLCLVVVPVAILAYSCNHLQALPSMSNWHPQHACCNMAHMHAHGATCAAFARDLMPVLASTVLLGSPVLMTMHASRIIMQCRNARSKCISCRQAWQPGRARLHICCSAIANRGCGVRSTLVNSRCSLSASTVKQQQQ